MRNNMLNIKQSLEKENETSQPTRSEDSNSSKQGSESVDEEGY